MPRSIQDETNMIELLNTLKAFGGRTIRGGSLYEMDHLFFVQMSTILWT